MMVVESISWPSFSDGGGSVLLDRPPNYNGLMRCPFARDGMDDERREDSKKLAIPGQELQTRTGQQDVKRHYSFFFSDSRNCYMALLIDQPLSIWFINHQ